MIIEPLTTSSDEAKRCSAAPPAPAGWHAVIENIPGAPPQPRVFGARASP